MKKLTSLFLLGTMFLMSGAFASEFAGTRVTVKATNTISADTVKVGDRVRFTVSNDVQNPYGGTIIQRGSSVEGVVTEATPKLRIGKSARMVIGNFSTYGTDGTRVDLNGNIVVAPDDIRGRSIALSAVVIPLFLLMHGKEALVEAGS